MIERVEKKGTLTPSAVINITTSPLNDTSGKPISHHWISSAVSNYSYCCTDREFDFTEESLLEIKEIVILILVGSSIFSLILINWYMSIDYFILCVWHSIALPVFHQYFACISSSVFPEKCCAGQHFKVDLYSASGNPKQRDDARYSLTVVDIQCSSAKNGKFAIFIIPQGTAKK